MKRFLVLSIALLIPWAGSLGQEETDTALDKGGPLVYVLPIRDNIMPPLLYVIRRGVKEAMDAEADYLILDMHTKGGRVDTTEKIINVLNQFPGKTVTFVNKEAYSAGAFISVATQQIYMAPQSVIGAAAPIIMAPGGGAAEMPDTVEVKMTSAISALVRAQAQKNGYRVEVVEAMIDKSKELKIDGEILNEKGSLLTLTNVEAAREVKSPPGPLLSSGTVENLDELLKALGLENAKTIRIEPTGAEQLATWINSISTLLLLAGIVGLYIEFKTPGFGIPGILGLVAFAIYFLGGYIAGLSGIEWVGLFALGLVLLILELFVFPGTMVPGIAGAGLILASLVMAMVDYYPGMPRMPSAEQLEKPVTQLFLACGGAMVCALILSRLLPKTSFYPALVSRSVSGDSGAREAESREQSLIDAEGTTLSPLHPGGKARFGDEILDVLSQGEIIDSNARVKIVGFSGATPIVRSKSK